MASASASAGIKVLSWNINGLKAKFEEEERKTKLLKIFGKFDIVLLQETHIGKMKDDTDQDWDIITEALSDKYKLVNLEDNQEEEEEEYEEVDEEVDEEEDEEGKEIEEDEEEEEEEEEAVEDEEDKPKTMYMTYFSSSRKGVAILVNKEHTLLTPFSKGGDYAWVHVEIDKQEYTFVSVYCHPREPDLIHNLMTGIFNSFSRKGLDVSTCRPVIGGDFNTTLNPDLDATRIIPAHAARREQLNAFLDSKKLSDVWREMRPETHRYTYIHKKKNTKSRLDYIFMLKNDLTYVKICAIRKRITNQVRVVLSDLSDHSAVSLTLKKH